MPIFRLYDVGIFMNVADELIRWESIEDLRQQRRDWTRVAYFVLGKRDCLRTSLLRLLTYYLWRSRVVTAIKRKRHYLIFRIFWVPNSIKQTKTITTAWKTRFAVQWKLLLAIRNNMQPSVKTDSIGSSKSHLCQKRLQACSCFMIRT